MQTAVLLLTVVLVVALGALWWVNRQAEALQVPTLFVGTVAALATLLFGLKAKEVEPIRFPVEYVFTKAELMPLDCTWFPESTTYSTPANGAWETGFVVEKALRAVPVSVRDPDTLTRVFGDVLMSQIVDVLSWTFLKGCDSDVMRIDLAGTRRIQFNSKPFDKDVKVNREAIAKLFPGNTAMPESPLNTMYVPAGTTVERLSDGDGDGLRFRSRYATVSIRVVPQGTVFGQIGRLAQLCRLPVDFDVQQFGSTVFVVHLEASFTRLLAGAPVMKHHERWVAAMFESLSSFDSTLRWEKLQADYHLYYSQRTKTVYQELFESLQRKAQESKPPTSPSSR